MPMTPKEIIKILEKHGFVFVSSNVFLILMGTFGIVLSKNFFNDKNKYYF